MGNFKRELISGTLWKVIFYFTSFFLNVLFANYLGAVESGAFFYLQNNLYLIIFFLSFGIDSSLSYFNSLKEIPFGKLTTVAIFWSLIATLLFANLYPFFLQFGLITSIVRKEFVFVFFWGAIITANLSSLFLSSNDFKTPNVVPSFFNILLISFIGLTMFHSRGILSSRLLFEVYIASTFFTGCSLMVIVLKNVRLSAKDIGPFLINQFFRYSGNVFLANIFITLLLRSDIWLVKGLCSETDLGNYIQTAKFLPVILILPTLASFTLFPLITQNINNDKKLVEIVLKLISLYIYFSFIVCLAIGILGFWLFPFLYGSSFSKMYLTFLCFCPGALALAGSYPLTPYFSGKNLNRVIANSSLLATLLMLLLDFILIPKFSIYGAAIGSSVAYIFYFLQLLWRFHKLQKFKFGNAFNFNYFSEEVSNSFKQIASR